MDLLLEFLKSCRVLHRFFSFAILVEVNLSETVDKFVDGMILWHCLWSKSLSMELFVQTVIYTAYCLTFVYYPCLRNYVSHKISVNPCISDDGFLRDSCIYACS